MSTFRYVEPTDLGDAVKWISDPDEDVHLLAGGTALVPLLKSGYVRPSTVVGMRRLGSLRAIEAHGGGLRVGTLATHGDVTSSPLVRDGWGLLAEACGRVGTVRIRNQATLGGNLVHADPNQDPPPALLVLDATVRIVGPEGERRLPVDELFIDVFETSLQPGEILLDIEVPALPPGSRTLYRKFLPRSQDDYATVAVAALARQDRGGRVHDLRVGLGGAGPRPVRLRDLEAALTGEVPSAGSIQAAVATIGDLVDPIDDARGSAAYKRAMASVWVERALGDVLGIAIA